MLFFLLMSLINMMRYVIMQYLIRLKDQTWQQTWKGHAKHNLKVELGKSVNADDMYKKTEMKVRIANIFLGWWTMIPWILLSFLIWAIIETLVIEIGSAIAGERCVMGSAKGVIILYVMQGVNIGIFVLVAIVTMIFFAIDMVLFCKAKGCAPLKYFKHDALFFRSEYLLQLIWFIFGSGITYVAFYFKLPPSITLIVLVTAIEGCNIFTHGGFLLIVAIIQTCIVSRKKFNPNSIEGVVMSPLGCEKFLQFSQREWSGENVMAFIEIQEIKQIKRNGVDVETGRVLKIIDLYIKPGACIEVNLPHKVKKELMKFSAENEFTKANVAVVEDIMKLFEPVERELLLNLTDTFARWMQTREYARWARSAQNL
jgi:hypothetical protein